jgi:hypothetical protein
MIVTFFHSRPDSSGVNLDLAHHPRRYLDIKIYRKVDVKVKVPDAMQSARRFEGVISTWQELEKKRMYRTVGSTTGLRGSVEKLQTLVGSYHFGKKRHQHLSVDQRSS